MISFPYFFRRAGAPLVAMLLLSAAGCASGRIANPASTAVTPELYGDPARPAQAVHWLRSELYFAIAVIDDSNDTDPGLSAAQAQWRSFLDREVTPRFRDGLTVLDGEGQWLPRGQPMPHRLRSKILVILHQNTAQQRNSIDAIRLAWKRATGHQSVLWSQQPVDVSF